MRARTAPLSRKRAGRSLAIIEIGWSEAEIERRDFCGVTARAPGRGPSLNGYRTAPPGRAPVGAVGGAVGRAGLAARDAPWRAFSPSARMLHPVSHYQSVGRRQV